jgi:hypothetical protein
MNFAASRQNRGARTQLHHRLDQACHRINQVLAVVEHKQEVSVANGARNRLRRSLLAAKLQPQHPGHRGRSKSRVRERRKLNEPCAMLEIREQTVGGLYGECGFPHPACACQSHDPVCGDEVTHPLHGHRSADQFADDHRQVAGSALWSLVAWFGSGRRLAHPVVPDGPTSEQSIAATR